MRWDVRSDFLSHNKVPCVDVFDRRIANGKWRIVRPESDPVAEEKRGTIHPGQVRNLLNSMTSHRDAEDCATLLSIRTKVNIPAVMRPAWIIGCNRGEGEPHRNKPLDAHKATNRDSTSVGRRWEKGDLFRRFQGWYRFDTCP